MAKASEQHWMVQEAQALVAQAPWWLCSAVVHLVIIVLLAMITFTTIEPPRRKIQIEVPLEQLEERLPPPTKVDVLKEEADATAEPILGANVIESRAAAVVADADTNAPVIGIEMPTPQDLSKLVAGGGPALFNPFGKAGVGGTNLVSMKVGTGRIGMSYDDVMDQMAESIVKEIQRNDLLVVLLFDESKSLLEDRKIIMQKVNRVVNDLKKEMKPKESARLKWAVISYSAKPTLWLQPTANVDEVVQSIQKIKVDESGVENVCAGILSAIKTFGPMNKKMFLINVSDEDGNDTRNEKAYAEAVQVMQAAKARFYTFGREAQFQQYQAFEWLRDSKGERIGPWFWADRGIETCQFEIFQTDWRWNPHRGAGQMGSGFGPYSLTNLCEQTKGVFFILAEVPSPYDEEKLEKFKPEWVMPADYKDRNGKSKLRATIRKIVDEWQKVTPPGELWQLDRLKAEMAEAVSKGEKALKFVEGAIDEMETLRGRKAGEKFAKQRWEANFDLMMGQLYKLRFNMREYLAVLREAQRKGLPKPRPNQKFNHFDIYYNAGLKEPHTGLRGVKEWEQANKALQDVANQYDGTPWGELGKYLKARTAPGWINPDFHIAITRVKG
jgi:hypothetical protein